MNSPTRSQSVSLPVVVLAMALAGCAGPGHGPVASQPAPPPQEIRLPGIVVVPAAGEVRIDGRVCIDKGILEYLAVGPRGKAYESLFVLDCRPSQLQMAMFVAGWQDGELPPHFRGDFAAAGGTRPASQPARGPGSRPAASRPVAARAEGSPQVAAPPEEYWSRPKREPTRVTIDVDVSQADGSWRRCPVESLLMDRRTHGPPARMTWAFTGSFFARNRRSNVEVFAADVEQSIIAMWYDPTALLNAAQDAGNPYRDGSTGLEVAAGKVPPGDTPVRLVLRRESPR